MNSIAKETLDKLEQCDDFHNRCDYLMEHSEITYLLEYIKELQEENKQLKEGKNKAIEHIMKYYKNVLKRADDMEKLGFKVDRKVPLYDELLEILG